MIRALAAVSALAGATFARSFALPSSGPLSGNAVALAAGAVNHRGRPDLVAAYTAGAPPAPGLGVAVALATGPDAFAPATGYANGVAVTSVRAVALGDLNGDGDL